jgi:hypothetical protein
MADEKDSPLDAFEHGPVEHLPVPPLPGELLDKVVAAGRKLMARKAAGREPWIIPSDIPKLPSKTLVIRGSGGRRWESSDPEIVAAGEAFISRAATHHSEQAEELDALTYTMFGVKHVMPAPAEPDYEALGYPETRVYLDDLDTVAQWERNCQHLIMPRAIEWQGDAIGFNVAGMRPDLSGDVDKENG